MSNPVFNLVNIYSEATPNPETMKFVSNRLLIGESMDFASVADTKESPVAKRLFEFPFVKHVFISQNYITITKNEGEDWDEIIPVLKDFVKNYLEAGLPIFEKAKEEFAEEDTDNSEVAVKIKDILRTYVQPAVEQDGGAIQFRKFNPESGVVTVVLKGACKGCPSSIITLKSGIENLLKRMVPEVLEVVSE